MNLLFKIFANLIILLSISFPASGQPNPSPISLGATYLQQELGFYVGLGQNMQSGDMLVDCEECVFKSGVKFGYTLGLMYEADLFSRFRWGVLAEYNYRGYEALFSEIESVPIYYQLSDKTIEERANLKFNHNADVDLSYLGIAPFIKWDPWDFVFLRMGLDFSFGLSSNIVHVKQLDQKTLKISTGEIKEIYIDKKGNRQSEVQNSELNGFKSFAIGLRPALGFTIPFSKSVFFSPIFEYYIPMTSISDFSKELSVSSWRLLFELRIVLEKRTGRR